MITSNQVLAQIEKHVQQAKSNVQHEALLRDEIIAVKTLCDMLLNTERPSIVVEREATYESLQPIRAMQPTKVVEEDDANGVSIFDF